MRTFSYLGASVDDYEVSAFVILELAFPVLMLFKIFPRLKLDFRFQIVSAYCTVCAGLAIQK